MALLAVMKTEEKCIKCFTSSHNLSSCFYKVCIFPFWVLSHWKYVMASCKSFSQLVISAVRHPLILPPHTSTKNKNMGKLMGSRQAALNMAAHFFPTKSVHMPNMLLHFKLSGLITHAHMVYMSKPDPVFIATVYSFRNIQHFRRVQHLWVSVSSLLVTF